MKDLTYALDEVKAKKAAMDEAKAALVAASEEHQKAVDVATKLHEEFTESVSQLLPSVSKVRSA